MTCLGLMEWTSRWLRLWQKNGQGNWRAEILQNQAELFPLTVCYAAQDAGWRRLLGLGWLMGTSPWQVGWPAWKTLGRRPAGALSDFLPDWRPDKLWRIGSRKITSQRLLQLILAPLHSTLRHCPLWGMLLPSYWDEAQFADFTRELHRAGLISGVPVAQDLALACAAWQQHGPWNLALVVDLDDHALVVTQASCREPDVFVQRRLVVPELGRRIWIARLINLCAELSIRLCRQDPRLSRQAFQHLAFELTTVLPRLHQEHFHFQLHVSDFHAEFSLTPELVKQACLQLAQASAKLIKDLLAPHTEVFLSRRLADLPDMIRVVYQTLEHRRPIYVVDETPYLEAAGQLASSAEACAASASSLWRYARVLPDWVKAT
ncbi:MAG: hypothetical protein RMI91_01985 [Gemmatales bacterium]|nr:hypothetical protein [Gemmatales bacterium]MDW7993396.1 hypothetical protein [Gemmatales bacterium]